MRRFALAALPLALLAACGGGDTKLSVNEVKAKAMQAGLACTKYEQVPHEANEGEMTGWSVCDGEEDNPAPGVQIFTFSGDSAKAARGWKAQHADVLQRDNWLLVDRERMHGLKALADGMDAKFTTGD